MPPSERLIVYETGNIDTKKYIYGHLFDSLRCPIRVLIWETLESNSNLFYCEKLSFADIFFLEKLKLLIKNGKEASNETTYIKEASDVDNMSDDVPDHEHSKVFASSHEVKDYIKESSLLQNALENT